MTRPRSTLVSLSDTPWYHLVNRCVRRAFLCGQDAVTGISYEHRRGWIVERIQQLSAVFAVDVAAYAVMSNHYHLVVRVDAERVRSWSQEEVLSRWTQLFEGPLLVRQVLAGKGDELDEASLLRVAEYAETYRQRLADLSWFMRVLNETIARKANAEDEVKGRFWEGRFKSQALLDEQAVLSAMAYVDLNPIRAQMAETPEESEFTSIAERLAQLAAPKRPYQRKHQRKAQPETSSPEAHAETTAPEQSPSIHLNGIKLRCECQLAQIAPQPLMPFDATARLKTGPTKGHSLCFDKQTKGHTLC
jgi:REP element-mobilizing transposase RayT